MGFYKKHTCLSSSLGSILLTVSLPLISNENDSEFASARFLGLFCPPALPDSTCPEPDPALPLPSTLSFKYPSRTNLGAHEDAISSSSLAALNLSQSLVHSKLLIKAH